MSADELTEARDQLASIIAPIGGTLSGLAFGTNGADIEGTYAWVMGDAVAADLAARLTEGAAAVETVKRVEAFIEEASRRTEWFQQGRTVLAALRIVVALEATPQPDAAQVAEPAQGFATMAELRALRGNMTDDEWSCFILQDGGTVFAARLEAVRRGE